MKKAARPATRRQTIGKKAFAAISAVEGLQLGKASQDRLRALEMAGLSFEERRVQVLQAYAGATRRK